MARSRLVISFLLMCVPCPVTERISITGAIFHLFDASVNPSEPQFRLPQVTWHGIKSSSNSAHRGPTAMIHLSNITRQHGSQVLFRDASFQILPGSRSGLVGPNG